jgi:transaldolase/glucose-6-phosphate isomerase
LLLPVQAIFPGILESAYRREFQNLTANNAVPRLWAKDTSLWPVEEHQTESVKNNLGWLDLPAQLGPLMARVAARAGEIEAAGFEDVVFVTMGGSNLAAETILRLPSAKIGKRSFLLDTIDPDSVRALEEMLCLDRTLFVFANKSGKGIETHSLFLYFLEKLKTLGHNSPARHFVALTEENSYLSQLAGQYEFLDSFLDPRGIHGRFSSLIHFNLFLAAVCRLPPSDLLARTQSMRDACGPSAPLDTNPALSLAALLAAAEIEGLDRLVFFSTDSLKPVSRRIGCLVGASTGKEGRGIVPVFGQSSYPLEMLQSGCLVACLKMTGEEQRELRKKCDELHRAGVPIVSIELNGPEELGVELFKWEIATAVACSLLNVDPFHDPDVRESRSETLQILEHITTGHQTPLSTVRVRESEIELYAEGETRRQISTLSMADALGTFFDLREQDGYLALLPFIGINANRKAIFRRLRDQLVSALGIPVLTAPGPRYLHGLGQMFKGGPPKGLFLLITTEPAKDLPIPGASYSFGQLQMALALGDFDSLGRHQRHVIRLHLASGAEQGLLQLETILKNALKKIHTITP